MSTYPLSVSRLFSHLIYVYYRFKLRCKGFDTSSPTNSFLPNYSLFALFNVVVACLSWARPTIDVTTFKVVFKPLGRYTSPVQRYTNLLENTRLRHCALWVRLGSDETDPILLSLYSYSGWMNLLSYSWLYYSLYCCILYVSIHCIFL